jgi:CRISPR/Cas system CSM-associated protein Csm2 small subunit
MANRPQPKGAGARSTPAFIAKDTKEEKPVVKQKKLSPTVDKAITKMAEEQGVPKDEFMKTFDEFRDKLQAESKEDLKGLQDLIEKQSGRSKEIKEQALGKALAEFGFSMAAQASKKGRQGHGQGFAGLLGSAAAASPVIAASAAESQKLAAAADDNDMKLQMELRKFNIATRKNDSATAMQHATNMRQLQQTQETIKQQQAQLAETIRANQARERLLGQQIAARSGTAGLRGMQAVARNRTEAIKLARADVDGKIKASGMPVKPEDYDRMINQALKKYLPMTTGFGMTGVSSSKDDDDDDIIDLG